MKRQICLYILLIFNVLSIFSESIKRDIRKDEILFICSYNSDAKYTHASISDFVDNYIKSGGKFTPVVESLNCTSLSMHKTWMNNMHTILDKHTNARLIILLGPEAWACYFSLTDEKYKKIPVYCLMSQRYFATLDNPELTAVYREATDSSEVADCMDFMKDFNVKLCYYYKYGVKEDIQLIHSLYPATQHIAIISDNSYAGISQMKYVKDRIQNHYPHLQSITIDGSKMDMAEALDATRQLPDHTASILCIWRYDRKNVTHMSNAEYAFTKANQNLPVFSLTGSSIGYWAIGGCIPDYNSVNANINMAQKAFQLLDKEEDAEPDFYCYPNTFNIDSKMIRRFNLEDKKLPKDAQYINNYQTCIEFIKEHKWNFILLGTFLIAIISGFIVSVFYSMRLRKMKKSLEKSDAQLRIEKKELEASEHNLLIAKEKSEEANRMKTKFVSNMSHEIRTPLNAIVGFSGILASAVEENKQLKEYVSIIQHNSDLLLKLINDILDISRLENDNTEFNYEPCQLNALCNSIVDSLKLSAPEHVELRTALPKEDIPFITDASRLQQVLINLLNNAIKFTDKGSVELSLMHDDANRQLVFTVTDTGCGIPPEEHKHVFERFKKLNEYKQGTGLGLSICKIIIHKLGGKISIDSTYQNGARFVFTLPMKDSE